MPFEVFDKIKEFESYHDKVKYLQDNQSFVIKTILQANFDPNIIFDLPSGTPPDFVPDASPPEMSLSRIDKAVKVLPRFLKTDRTKSLLEKGKDERKFIDVLESVSARDAEIIVAAKDKTLESLYPEITKELAKAAFPTIIP